MNGDGCAASSANVDDGSWSRSVLFGGGARGCDEWGIDRIDHGTAFKNS